MRVVRMLNGNLLVPARSEGPGGIIGDGMVEVAPSDPDYQKWLPFVTEMEPPESELARRYRASREKRTTEAA